jgi:plasmid maintenance system antidote protein VapI
MTEKRPTRRWTAAPALLVARLAELHMTQVDFARRTGRSKKTVHEVLTGASAVTWKFAIHSEYVLGLRAADLMAVQAAEQLAEARQRLYGTTIGLLDGPQS